jgi:hypothetical protein
VAPPRGDDAARAAEADGAESWVGTRGSRGARALRRDAFGSHKGKSTRGLERSVIWGDYVPLCGAQ